MQPIIFYHSLSREGKTISVKGLINFQDKECLVNLSYPPYLIRFILIHAEATTAVVIGSYIIVLLVFYAHFFRNGHNGNGHGKIQMQQRIFFS